MIFLTVSCLCTCIQYIVTIHCIYSMYIEYTVTIHHEHSVYTIHSDHHYPFTPNPTNSFPTSHPPTLSTFLPSYSFFPLSLPPFLFLYRPYVSVKAVVFSSLQRLCPIQKTVSGSAYLPHLCHRLSLPACRAPWALEKVIEMS